MLVNFGLKHFITSTHMYGKSVMFIKPFSLSLHRICSVRNYCQTNLLGVLANMPKVTHTSHDSSRAQGNTQKHGSKAPPSNVYLQVVGSGARGAPNALYLFTDHNRYLFNCGESTQRIALEHKVKVSRLDHIFITSKSWRNLGGLPGLSITLQQVGVSDITLHGPEGLDLLYKATRGFVVMQDMNINLAKCSPSEDYEDEAMNVKYVLLYSPNDVLNDVPAAKRPKLADSAMQREYEEFINDTTDYYSSGERAKALEREKAHEKEAAKKNKSPLLSRGKPKVKDVTDPLKKKNDRVLADLQNMSKCYVAYICTLKKRLGMLNLEKCVEQGVKPGPLLGKLKNGQDVVLPDGTLVLASSVKNPDEPGPVFIVIEIPDVSYLRESDFKSHFNNGFNPPENIPALIVHFSPPYVFHNPIYQSFMTLFGPTTRHLVLNEQNTCLGSEAVHRMQNKLHLLDQEIFPLLHDVSIPAEWNTQLPIPKTSSPLMLKGLEELKNKFQNIINLESSCKGDSSLSSQATLKDADRKIKMDVVAGRTLTTFHLRPLRQFGFDRTQEPKLHIQDYIQEAMDTDGFVHILDKFRRTAEDLRYAKSDMKEFPKVVFLGTGSSMPGKTRNVSSIAVQISENRAMLLDCGEGTYMQIVRFYGQKRSNNFLRNLRAIYVSHLHADHHLGLLGVLQARRQAFLSADLPIEPLYLLAPGQIMAWLSVYDKHFEKVLGDFTLVPNQSLLPHLSSAITAPAILDIGLSDVKTCFVRHCPNAFGVSVQIDDRYKITYSGDTIPCEELIKIGDKSTLLIHEATMEDELEMDARIKMHSTMSQAIEVGRLMGASYTVLTHFSQRYARIPRLVDHLLQNNVNVGIAYDNMQITMSDLDILPHMYAPLQLMFAEHCVEMELRAAQRQKHLERKSSSPSPGTSRSSSSDNSHKNKAKS